MRADLYLYKFGYSKSREAAKRSIEADMCRIDGALVPKASFEVDETIEHRVDVSQLEPYVGRGGLKLCAALDTFLVDVSGFTCIDIGASTGGFTDCLLQHGARKVYAVDSGHGQLAVSLTENPSVVSIEGFNARFLGPETAGELCDMAVMDVSFISQTLILPNIKKCLKENGFLISLIKPQFECGKSAIGKGGIVKNKNDRKRACENVLICASNFGLFAKGLIKSPITGGDGNTEYLCLFTAKPETDIKSLTEGFDF